MDLAMDLAARGRRRHRRGQRPRRRPLRRGRPGGPHGWQMLRGDEVGALLAEHLLELRREGVYATSIVSSSLLGKMAVAESQLYAETLTGFKWIGRVREPRVRLRGGAWLLRRPGPREGQGRHLRAADRLRHRRPGEGRRHAPCATCSTTSPGVHGLHATDQLSVRMDDLAAITGRRRPAARQPTGLARGSRGRGRRRPVEGFQRAAADHRPALPAGRQRAGGRAPVGDGAEDQVLPRGRRTRRGRGGRSGRRPDLGRGSPRRDSR